MAASRKSCETGGIQVVMIMPEYNLERSGNYDNRPVFCKLRHPKSRQPAMYMFSHENQKILELITFEENFRSWFIGDSVQKDGSFWIASSVDPVFLILPYLASTSKSGKFMQMECILEDSDFPDSKCLSFCALDDLDSVADVKDISGSRVYRYNKGKTLSWLRLKFDRLLKTLKQTDVDVSSGAMLSTFTRSNKSTSDDSPDDYLRYASGLIVDYLEPELAKDFLIHLGIPLEEPATADDSSSVNPPAAKKSRIDILSPLEDYSQPNASIVKKAEKMTAAQKLLSKVDKGGMKSISSFFGQKTAKK